MKILNYFLLLLISSSTFSESLILKAQDCELLGGKLKPEMKAGQLFNSICKVNAKNAYCIHMDSQNNILNKSDEYEVLHNDFKQEGLWKSPMGNISIYLNYSESKFYMGMVYFAAEAQLVITKYCVGTLSLIN